MLSFPYEQAARQCLLAGDHQQALQRFEALLQEGFLLSTASLLNLATLYQRSGRWAEALPLLRKAIEREPDLADAHFLAALVEQQQGDHARAAERCRRVLDLDPASATAWNLLGEVQATIGADPEEASACFEAALALQPDLAPALNNLGNLHWRARDVDGAIAFYRRMIAADPSLFQGFHNLGRALQDQGLLDQAADCYLQALELNPGYADSGWNLSICCLLQGNYVQGWRYHDERLRLSGPPRLHAQPSLPLWTGECLDDSQPLLLVSEQGFGDSIQFMRYVNVLRERGVQVRLSIPAQLHDLAIASGIDEQPLAPAACAEITDGVWLPLLSLPRLLGVSPAEPQCGPEPYLKPLKAQVRAWADRLRDESLPVIGIHWQGNHLVEADNEDFRGRSLPLEAFRPIAETNLVRLLSLQKGYGSEQLQACSFAEHFVGCQQQVDQTWDFLETAAIIENCDLVITSDSAVAHLAAGLGKPTWLLLKCVPEWRWGLESETTFWYPSMRLFRQREPGDWSELLARVAAELTCYLSRSPRPQARVAGAYGNAWAVRSRRLQTQCLGWMKPFWTWVASAGAADAALGGATPGGLTASEMQTRLSVIEALTEADALENAEILARQLIALTTGSAAPEPHQALGLIALRAGDLDAAICSFVEALRWEPSSADPLCGLAICWHKKGALARAERLYRRALGLGCSRAGLLSSFGVLLHEQGRLDEAIDMQQQALQLEPTNAGAHFNLAACLLARGAYDAGWPEYEWRLSRPRVMTLCADPDLPRWDGRSTLVGRRLLVMAEQGLGDAVQFARYLPFLAEAGADLVVAAPQPLHRLLLASGLCSVICRPEESASMECDLWFPLASIPGWLGVTPDHPVANNPYIRSNHQQAERWRSRLAAEARPRIGLCWQGNPSAEQHVLRGRSMPLEAFAPLLVSRTPALLALQKGSGLEQLERCSFQSAFVGCQSDISAQLDFDDVAAVLANCDLIISVDTAVAHLAGAMGLPTWLLLHRIPDWRWGLEGDSTFWYPTMRLFRQHRDGDWSELMQRVAAALDGLDWGAEGSAPQGSHHR